MKMTAAPFRNHLVFLAFSFLGLAGAASCGGDDAPPTTEGKASGATCPTDSTLTYETFGRAFMTTYCTRCHSSTATDRMGAPADHNFDTLIGTLTMAEHIDEEAAAGPASTNTSMPPDGTKPTDDERKKLGQWLACELSGDDGGTKGDSGGTGDSGGSQGDGGNRDATVDSERGQGDH